MAGGDSLPASLQHFIIDNIQLGKQIGRGANGRILEAKWEGIVVAVKEIHSIFINEASEVEFQAFSRSFLRECEQSSQLRHPNIVRFLGVYHPPGIRVPSLVMERLHCSLTSLLEQNRIIAAAIKTSIINDVALGIRYLHSHNPPIIHRDLSSNNVLISKGMEGKIGDLGTARLVDPKIQTARRMTKAPGTVDFMAPEALAASENIRYGRTLDVFSFGCVMLHTFSHQWPTPSAPVVTDPETGLVTRGRSEIERRGRYFSKLDRSHFHTLIPMIKTCLNNLPKNRISIVRVCQELESRVDNERVNNFTMLALQEEIQRKDAEIKDKNTQLQYQATELHRKDVEIQDQATELYGKDIEIATLRSQLSSQANPQVTDLQSQPRNSRKIDKESIDFWNSLKLSWKQCADLPVKCQVTSITELDGSVYVSLSGQTYPLKYDSRKDGWSQLPALPVKQFSLVSVPDKEQLLAIGGTTNNIDVKVCNKIFQWDEVFNEWLDSYPDMPTARFYCSCVCQGSMVIVSGGVTRLDSLMFTRAVEILHTNHLKSYWSVVKQIPIALYQSVPFIINDVLFVAGGFDKLHNTPYVFTVPLQKLMGSRNDANSPQVWERLSDMPYPSMSINHYQGRLLTFGGCCRFARHNLTTTSQIHLYNPDTTSWDCVGKIQHLYYLWKSVHLTEKKILFVGGLTSDCVDTVTTSCTLLTIL